MQRTEINADDGAKGGILGVVRRADNGENAQSSQESREPHGDDTCRTETGVASHTGRDRRTVRRGVARRWPCWSLARVWGQGKAAKTPYLYEGGRLCNLRAARVRTSNTSFINKRSADHYLWPKNCSKMTQCSARACGHRTRGGNLHNLPPCRGLRVSCLACTPTPCQ